MPTVYPTIILNPASGQGDPAQRRKKIVQAAHKLGWKGKIIETTPDRLATFAARQELKAGVKQFVVCGGDGTLIEAIEALVNKDVCIGIVPLGTGNLLAKNLNIPLDIQEAMDIALHGAPLSIDIGQANDSYFAIMAGMGLDARIMQETSRQLKNYFGLAAYYFSGIKKLWQEPVRFEVIIDGKAQQFKAKTVLVANMAKFAGDIKAVPDTNPQDGSLKVGIIKARTLGQMLNLATAAAKGNINKSPYYTLLEGKNIKIKPLGRPQPYQCDGNSFPPVKQLAIKVHPQAIRIMTPGKYHE